ncbi:MAG: glycosyltransferase family 2 protein [Bacillota bacterium]|nr:glycosyltransferase family 2 protein [Bacillota bacterium]
MNEIKYYNKTGTKYPLFSVVVPVYNIEKYIEDCIHSLQAQTFENIEIILVDDGSTDNCSQICDKYAETDSKITVIHKKNGGLVSARQAGVEMAHGEYVACIDGDDWIDKNYFNKFSQIIELYNPDIICCGAVWAFSNHLEEQPYNLQLGMYKKEDIIKNIYPIIEGDDGKYFPPSLWAKVFRKELYLKQQLAVNTRIKIGEDHACVKPCIYEANSLYIMEDCLYYYRQNDMSMTKNRKAFDVDGPQLIGEHFEKQLPINEFDFKEQVNRNVVHNLFNVCVSQFNRPERYKKIRASIIQLLRRDYYKNAIDKCNYAKSIGSNLTLMCLKYKLCILIWIYSRFK